MFTYHFKYQLGYLLKNKYNFEFNFICCSYVNIDNIVFVCGCWIGNCYKIYYTYMHLAISMDS